jgi:hypothetical protein
VISSEAEAREVALRHLRSEMEPGVGEELATTDIREYPTCWVVGYNTRVYLETGSISHALAGGGPLIINRASGCVRMGNWNAAIEDQLDDQ